MDVRQGSRERSSLPRPDVSFDVRCLFCTIGAGYPEARRVAGFRATQLAWRSVVASRVENVQPAGAMKVAPSRVSFGVSALSFSGRGSRAKERGYLYSSCTVARR